MLLAVDPGKGKVDSIGWALFNDDYTLNSMGQKTLVDFVNWLETLQGVDEVVWEEYRVYKKRLAQHTNSKVETVQTIGALKSWCLRHRTSYVEQRADILAGAQKLFQIEMPNDHTVSHQFSALLHGMWYLYCQGKIKSALQEELGA